MSSDTFSSFVFVCLFQEKNGSLQLSCEVFSLGKHSNLSFVTSPGAKGSTHSSGFTSSGISGGSRASQMMSNEATSCGGGVPKGGTTSTIQSICKSESS